MKTGVIIGRFQTPYLHAGHLYLIGTAIQECEKVLILLGCSHGKDERNPYDFEQRMVLLKKVFPQVDIIPLFDEPENDAKWSARVDFNTHLYNAPILYHSRDSFVS